MVLVLYLLNTTKMALRQDKAVSRKWKLATAFQDIEVITCFNLLFSIIKTYIYLSYQEFPSLFMKYWWKGSNLFLAVLEVL